MPRRTPALLAGALALLLSQAATGSPALAGPADAPLRMTPLAATPDVVPTFTTAAPCPTGSDETHVQLFGGRFPREGQVVRDISPFGSTSRAFSLRGSRSLAETALDAGFAELDGAYVAELACVTRLGVRLATFSARFTVGGDRVTVEAADVADAPEAGRIDGRPTSPDEPPVPQDSPVPPVPAAAPASDASSDGGGGLPAGVLGAVLGGGAVAGAVLGVPALRRASRRRAGSSALSRPSVSR